MSLKESVEKGNESAKARRNAEIEEKGLLGYIMDRIKKAVSAVVWFIPTAITYAIHGKVISGDVMFNDKDPETSEKNTEKEQEKEREDPGEEVNMEKESPEIDDATVKEELTNEEAETIYNDTSLDENVKEGDNPPLNLENKEIEVEGVSIENNRLNFKGIDFQTELSAEDLRDPGIVDNLSNLNVENLIQATQGSGVEKLSDKHYGEIFTDQIIKDKVGMGIFIGTLREEQGYVDRDGSHKMSEFTLNDEKFELMRNGDGDIIIKHGDSEINYSENKEDLSFADWLKEESGFAVTSKKEVQALGKEGMEFKEELEKRHPEKVNEVPVHEETPEQDAETEEPDHEAEQEAETEQEAEQEQDNNSQTVPIESDEQAPATVGNDDFTGTDDYDHEYEDEYEYEEEYDEEEIEEEELE